MCGIKIIVLANLPSGFEKVSSEWTLRMNKGGAILDSFRAECDTFYLLHHQCGSPGALSDPAHCNHFAFLQAVASIPSNANIVCFSGQNQPDFYDFYRDKKEDSGDDFGIEEDDPVEKARMISCLKNIKEQIENQFWEEDEREEATKRLRSRKITVHS
jgi:hypothetical protein